MLYIGNSYIVNLNRTLCIPELSLNCACIQVKPSIFAVHIEPPKSGNLS